MGALPVVQLVQHPGALMPDTHLTLEDIAQRAGVSRSTVSRVLNDQPNVRDQVRERVWRVIEQTGYRPNSAARTLASQRSHVIGLVLPLTVSSFFTDPYFPFLTQGIAQACNQYDQTLSLFIVATAEDEKKLYPRIAQRGLLDGVVLQAGAHGDLLSERLTQSSLPIAMIGRPLDPEATSFINVDNVASAVEAVNHLVSLGHQRIATITGPQNTTAGIDRLVGYRRSLKQAGLPDDETLIAYGDFSDDGGYAAMQQLLPAKPDALFAASDRTAIGAIRAIRAAGLRVPADIAVVGFDDLPLAVQADVPLTTIRQPVEEVGRKAVEMLIDIIEHGNHPPRRILLDTELVIRDSCGSAGRA